MNLRDLRTRVQLLRSREVPTANTKGYAKFDQCIDLAYKRLASECPAALLPDTDRVVLLPQHTDVSTGTLIAPTTDPWVMQFVATTIPTFTTTDGTWDGIYHLEITDSTGRVHRRQCREFWLGSAPTFFPYVSIDRPWPTSITGSMKFRLYQPEFFTTDDVLEIVDASVFDTTRGVMFTVAQSYVHYMGWDDVLGDNIGRPNDIYRTRHYQLDAPNRAPTATLITQEATWSTEGTGMFDYCFTYVWGKRDQEFVDPAGGFDPQWESSPSPVSGTVTVANTTSNVRLTLPTIDWQIAFDVPGTLRQTHSGLRKRIYRRRYTVTGSPPLVTNIEAPEVFQFLAEVDGAATTYTDDGTVIPGYYRRLPEVHGYYAWRATPQQDQRYEIDLRVYRRPRTLVNDYDAPRVSPECIDTLVMLACHYYCQADNDDEGAQRYLVEALRLLGTYRARHASPARSIDALTWDGSINGSERRHWIGRARV